MLSSVFCFTYIHSNRTVFYFLRLFRPGPESRKACREKIPQAQQDDYFTATSPQAALPGFSGHGATFAGRNEMPLSPYPVFTVSYCRENPF
ncbi:hypothetical protein DW080_04990 [Bacteroides caccae]|nr:hypothetical protein DW080_04990 [Bacteroides caccae]